MKYFENCLSGKCQKVSHSNLKAGPMCKYKSLRNTDYKIHLFSRSSRILKKTDSRRKEKRQIRCRRRFWRQNRRKMFLSKRRFLRRRFDQMSMSQRLHWQEMRTTHLSTRYLFNKFM
jgi:hypothetical protein